MKDPGSGVDSGAGSGAGSGNGSQRSTTLALPGEVEESSQPESKGCWAVVMEFGMGLLAKLQRFVF